MSGERAGLASTAVMTAPFVAAAELMAQVLGAPGYPFLVTDHPISSASPAELLARGRSAARTCAELLVTAP